MKRHELPTPCFVVSETALKKNLRILRQVRENTGCRILLAQKAFSMFRVYPLIAQYLDGAESSGLYEARLAQEEMRGENHVFAPAYTAQEMRELAGICSHIVFNSFTQLEAHLAALKGSGVSIGLRVNPEYSTQSGHAIYDPCAEFSRLGVTRANFQPDMMHCVEGLHFHTLCEQGSDDLIATFNAFEKSFGEFLPSMKWLNLGGGHHITRDGYDTAALERLINRIQEKWGLTVYLEPGEAVALDAGFLLTKVLDVVNNGMPVLIMDTSAACHMPDVLEMPYRPPLQGAGEPGTRDVTCRVAGRTCLAGDIIGDYGFDRVPAVGDTLVFGDMAIYSMVKTNTFNGLPLPAIAYERDNGDCELVKEFDYHDFKGRLS